jgi:hypothetical protein
MKQQKPEQLDKLAAVLDEVLADMYEVKRMGFALFTFDIGDSMLGDYIANCEREDMIKFMRELADRLEQGKTIGRVIGEA